MRVSRRVRRHIQASEESNAALARKYGHNVKTIAKWRTRDTIADKVRISNGRAGPVLDPGEEASAIAVRKITRWPLDVCLQKLKPLIPALTRSTLYRLFKEWRVTRAPSQLPRLKVSDAGEGGHLSLYLFSAVHDNAEYVLALCISQSTGFLFGKVYTEFDGQSSYEFLRDLTKAVDFPIASLGVHRHPAFCFLDAPASQRHRFQLGCRKRNIALFFEREEFSEPMPITKGWKYEISSRRRNMSKS